MHQTMAETNLNNIKKFTRETNMKNINKSIEELRKIKSELISRYEKAIEYLDKFFQESLENLDKHINTLNDIKSQLEGKADKFFDCFTSSPDQILSVRVPSFTKKKVKEKNFNIFSMDNPSGILTATNTKKCEHELNNFFQASCGISHCFDCLKANLSKNLDAYGLHPHEPIEVNIDENKKEESLKSDIPFTCNCEKKLTRRDLFIINYLNVG